MNINLNKKVVVITGAANGIGSNISKNFFKEGCLLSLWDVDFKGLKKLKNEFPNEKQSDILIIKCDVSSEKDINNAVNKTIEKYNSIDVLIANAGILNPYNILENPVKEWDDVFAVNTRGSFLCAKAVAPFMKKNNSGRIIFASSFAAIIPSVGSAAYAASKSAIVSLARVLSAEFGPWNITVNAYAPGMIPSDMSKIDSLSENRKNEMLDTLSIREWGKSDDISNLLIFLSSKYSRYITGTLIDISGGKFSVQFSKHARK